MSPAAPGRSVPRAVARAVGGHEPFRERLAVQPSIPSGRHAAVNADLTGSTFTDVCLRRAAFEDVNLGGATFHNIDLAGARFDDVNLSGAAVTNANVEGMT